MPHRSSYGLTPQVRRRLQHALVGPRPSAPPPVLQADALLPVHRRRLRAGGAIQVPGASPVSSMKAREILRHGEVHGQALTRKQRGLFGAIAGGSALRKG